MNEGALNLVDHVLPDVLIKNPDLAKKVLPAMHLPAEVPEPHPRSSTTQRDGGR